MKAKLEFLSGTKSGTEYELTQDEITIGRDPDRDLVFSATEEVRVSRHHATILRRADRWLARDDGSSNGTLVNDREIEAGEERELRTGDVIVFGEGGPRARLVIETPAPETLKARPIPTTRGASASPGIPTSPEIATPISPAEFKFRYLHLKRLAAGPVTTYLARAFNGDRVMVHYLQGPEDRIGALLMRIEGLGAADRQLIRSTEDADGHPAVVTEYLEPFESFHAWLAFRPAVQDSEEPSFRKATPPEAPPAGKTPTEDTAPEDTPQSDEEAGERAPGPFTRRFLAGLSGGGSADGPAAADLDADADGPTAADLDDGQWEEAARPSADAEPGEFTRLFGPRPREPREEDAGKAPTPMEPPPGAPSAEPSEFSRRFRGGGALEEQHKDDFLSEGGAEFAVPSGDPDDYLRRLAVPEEESGPGAVGEIDSPAASAPPPPPPPSPIPVPPAGPSEYTRLVGSGADSRPVPPPPKPAPSPPPPSAQPPKAPSRRRYVIALGLLLAGVVIIVLLFWLLGRSGDGSEPVEEVPSTEVVSPQGEG